jgi:hypothetical protein
LFCEYIYPHDGLIIVFLEEGLQLYANRKVICQCEEMVLHYVDTAPDGKILMICIHICQLKFELTEIYYQLTYLSADFVYSLIVCDDFEARQ